MGPSVERQPLNHQHEEVRSMVYSFSLVSRDGEEKVIQALGVESISKEGEYVPDEDTLSRFPEARMEMVRRSGGEVDVLMGMDVVNLHPTARATRGQQRLLDSGN